MSGTSSTIAGIKMTSPTSTSTSTTTGINLRYGSTYDDNDIDNKKSHYNKDNNNNNNNNSNPEYKQINIVKTPSVSSSSLLSHSNYSPYRVVKVVLIGDQAVGKTSLRSQFVHHIFSNSYRATIGCDFLTSSVLTKDGEYVNLQLWDTAGQERFNSLSQAFYRGTDIAILVYDITRPETFHNLIKWLNTFLQFCHTSNPSIIIVGNKNDKHLLKQISHRQAREFAEKNLNNELINNLNLDIIETSAKSYLEVEKLFKRIAELSIIRFKELNQPELNFDSIDISNPLYKKNNSWFSCC
ncbi:hypothetical protein B5S31_g5610 [[Candida] boidinii]|nr:hypothetical protein B5S31_g5610 [[Candida] boidinii]GME80598.1 unnamed protein product [[Candida] boidinii]